MIEHFLGERIQLRCGDCREILARLPENRLDACCTDPPYNLNFMGKAWDKGAIAFDPDTWRAVLRVLKPGAHLVAFGGMRTYHRLACAIEDAGFEVRDTIAWLYGSGFPKSHDVSKGIDRMLGGEREVVGKHPFANRGSAQSQQAVNLSGSPTREQFIYGTATLFADALCSWGTALKPAVELIILARKPLSEPTIAANVLVHGTGALNIDACRIPTNDQSRGGQASAEGENITWHGTDAVPNMQQGVSSTEESIEAQQDDNLRCGVPSDSDAEREQLAMDRGTLAEHGRILVHPDGSRISSGTSRSDGENIGQAIADDGSSPPPQRGSLRQQPGQSNALSKRRDPYQGPSQQIGRWPANLVHDGSAEVTACFPERASGGQVRGNEQSEATANIYGRYENRSDLSYGGDSGSAARFFYSAKADAMDRVGSSHPTVKPLDLTQWLVRLITPPRGVVLDCFAGTGTTGEAAFREGMSAVLIEREEEYCADIRRRMALALAGPDERARESVKARNLPRDDGPLFGWK